MTRHYNTGDDPSLPGGAFYSPPQPRKPEPKGKVYPKRDNGHRKAASVEEAVKMILGEL